jgi:hypothetical protein
MQMSSELISRQAPPRGEKNTRGETAAQRAQRAQRDRRRKEARRDTELSPERKALLEYAQRLITEAENAPDEETRKDLYKVASRLQVRNPDDPDMQRDAVFMLLEKWSLKGIAGVDVGLNAREIATETGLSLEAVTPALECLTSPEVNLVEMFTRGGRANCGRRGTTLYYRVCRERPPR